MEANVLPRSSESTFTLNPLSLMSSLTMILCLSAMKPCPAGILSKSIPVISRLTELGDLLTSTGSKVSIFLSLSKEYEIRPLFVVISPISR